MSLDGQVKFYNPQNTTARPIHQKYIGINTYLIIIGRRKNKYWFKAQNADKDACGDL